MGKCILGLPASGQARSLQDRSREPRRRRCSVQKSSLGCEELLQFSNI